MLNPKLREYIQGRLVPTWVWATTAFTTACLLRFRDMPLVLEIPVTFLFAAAFAEGLISFTLSLDRLSEEILPPR